MRLIRFDSVAVSILVVLVFLLFDNQSVAANTSTAPTTTGLQRGHIQHQFFFIPRGGGFIPAGYNPFGYKITELGEQYLKYDGSLDSDVGRFISTLKSGRKRYATIKEQWLEVMRISKSGQNMRIYRMLQELLDFCIKAGFID